MRLVIGIAGGSASGKSTLGRALKDHWGTRGRLVEQDAYYRDQAHLTPEDRLRTNYDHPDALESDLLVEHLRMLAAGRAVEIPRYDFIRHTRVSDTVHIPPCDVVVVAGLHVLSVPEVRACLGLAVYVDTATDIRLARRIQRDVAERGRDLTGVLDQWFSTVRPMHTAFVEPSKAHADLIVNGEAATAVAVTRVLSALPPPT